MSLIKKQLLRFLVAGLSAVGTDLIMYYLLINLLDINIAKGTSFLMGTVVAFVINKYWTFDKQKKSYNEMIKFGILYGLTFSANVLTNNIILDYTELVTIAFIMATGVSTVLNFIGQKWWVFK